MCGCAFQRRHSDEADLDFHRANISDPGDAVNLSEFASLDTRSQFAQLLGDVSGRDKREWNDFRHLRIVGHGR